MADTITSNLGLTKPEVTASNDTWGTKLNADLDIIDGMFTGMILKVANGGTGANTAAGARTNLGLVIGTNVQAWDADLDAIAALAGTSGFLKKTGTNTWALDTTSYLAASAIGSTVQGYDADLAAIAALTSAADRLPYFTGAGAAALAVFTAAGRALVDDADAAAQRTTLGLGSAATLNAGTSANNLVQLDGSAKLPALDGSQLTNLNAGAYTQLGQITTTSGTTQTFSGLALSSYKKLLIQINGCSPAAGNPTLQINGANVVSNTIAAAATINASIEIDLISGGGISLTRISGSGVNNANPDPNITNSTTSFSLTWSGGQAFDAGVITVLGIK